ncbi:MAG TPA: ABC transporter ATP-binding protein [archaeon]|nr:ABC transporter ATP-binding protein [archaeon]
MPNILRIENVSKKINNNIILNEISFSIEIGEIFGLLGPNGSGKSTLMRIISGVLDATSGTVYLNDKDTRQSRKEAKTKIVMVPQEFAFFSELSVKENLDYFASQINAGQKRVNEVIDSLELRKFSATPAEYLSGGYKRMLNIAISLLQNPEIIFLDEPSVGLDPVIRRELWDRILEIRAKGITVCISTHYMEEATALCDKVCLIQGGKIFALDTPENLTKKFANEQVGVFTLKQLPDEKLVSKITQRIKGTEASIFGTSIVVKFPEKNLELTEAAKSAIESSGYEILKLRIKEADLEQAFINLTGKQLTEN